MPVLAPRTFTQRPGEDNETRSGDLQFSRSWRTTGKRVRERLSGPGQESERGGDEGAVASDCSSRKTFSYFFTLELCFSSAS
jgi:hypothetical protein